jgi:6-phosphogluconolactonase
VAAEIVGIAFKSAVAGNGRRGARADLPERRLVSGAAVLRTPGDAHGVPWDRVDVCASDERWVPVDDEQSNELLLRRSLLARGAASAARVHSLYRAGQSVDEAAPEVSRTLADALDGPFDYCLLGMGADGHTASLFPDAQDIVGLLASAQVAVAVHVPRLAQARISLTASRLLQSRRIALLLFGEEKLSVLQAALAGGDVHALPVRCVLAQDAVPVTCHWAP